MSKDVIWKYRFPPQDEVRVAMPEDAAILSVGAQDSFICAWAIVDREAQLTQRTFFVRGTGHPPPPEPYVFLGTVFDGAFVWHVFAKFETGLRDDLVSDWSQWASQ